MIARLSLAEEPKVIAEAQGFLSAMTEQAGCPRHKTPLSKGKPLKAVVDQKKAMNAGWPRHLLSGQRSRKRPRSGRYSKK